MASDFRTQGPLHDYAYVPLEIIQGVSLRLRVSLTYLDEQSVEQPFLLTGCKVFFTCRKTADSEDIDIEKSTDNSDIEILDEVRGIVSIPMVQADTLDMVPGKYIYDILLETVDGNKYVPVRGDLKIIRSVTRPAPVEPEVPAE
jgi:hypothetical protein